MEDEHEATHPGSAGSAGSAGPGRVLVWRSALPVVATRRERGYDRTNDRVWHADVLQRACANTRDRERLRDLGVCRVQPATALGSGALQLLECLDHGWPVRRRSVLPSCGYRHVRLGRGGVQFACTFLGGSTTSTGLLATISITPLGTGCSPIHIFTLGGADGGDDSSGTYTVDAADSTTQLNAYGGDIGVNELGASCSLGGTPTPTDTNTSTPTVSPTPSATPSPTATPIPGAPDVTVSALSVPTSVDGGSLVSYSASVSNIGDAAAIGVTLDFALPVGDVPFKNGYCKT